MDKLNNENMITSVKEPGKNKISRRLFITKYPNRKRMGTQITSSGIKELYDKLYFSNRIISKLYCLLKIHKAVKSMLPITPVVRFPRYSMSRMLTKESEVYPT